MRTERAVGIPTLAIHATFEDSAEKQREKEIVLELASD